VIGDVLSLVGCAVVVVIAAGYLRAFVHRPQPASGDEELALELDALAGRRTRRLAVAVLDLETRPSPRMAFIDADEDTAFEIGSIAKGLTGMLLAQAIERGEISLDAPIASLLSETSASPLGSVSGRELCTHNSGLPPLPRTPGTLLRLLAAGWFGTDPYRGSTPSRVIAAARRQRLVHRGRYRYSNLGAAVLGHGLARAAGCDYPTLLHRRVLLPLGMAASGTDTGHRADRGWTGAGRRAWSWRSGGYGPAGGGIVSTAADMARLAAALLNGTAPGQGAITPIGAAEPGTPNRSMGMFWVIDRQPRSGPAMIWHNGQTGGYSAFLALYPEVRRAVAVLANVSGAREQERIAIGLARWLSYPTRESAANPSR
jgi:CubicO group peptidase (beta-lactamase class C family)